MRDQDDTHDSYHGMKLALGLCAAAVILVVGMLLLGNLGLGQRSGRAVPLQIAAHTVVPAAAASVRDTPSSAESAGYFHGAPFVTDAGGSEPGPLQQ